MLVIFTGNGKGKTTAALGQALRAVGNGSKVLVVQFIKGPWLSGEHRIAEKLEPELKIVRKGKGFVGILGDELPFEEHATAAHEALSYAQQEVTKNKWDMLIMDEVWNALQLKLIQTKDIYKFIDEVTPKVQHLVLTGRSCPQEFIDKADLVTEMREVKHPYNQGVVGSKNIEF